jgi:Holliday junction resolvase
MKNSRDKGKRGERQWRDELRANGYAARRGQQFSGSPDSPDVICDGLPWAHFEVKFVEHLNFSAAMAQARRDAGGKAAFVAHRRNHRPWLVTMDAERFYRLLRRDLSGVWATQKAAEHPLNVCAEFSWLRCVGVPPRANIPEAVRQAVRDAGKRVAVVTHQDRDGRWLVTITSETFFKFLRGTLPPENKPTEQQEQQKQNV